MSDANVLDAMRARPRSQTPENVPNWRDRTQPTPASPLPEPGSDGPGRVPDGLQAVFGLGRRRRPEI